MYSQISNVEISHRMEILTNNWIHLKNLFTRDVHSVVDGCTMMI